MYCHAYTELHLCLNLHKYPWTHVSKHCCSWRTSSGSQHLLGWAHQTKLWAAAQAAPRLPPSPHACPHLESVAVQGSREDPDPAPHVFPRNSNGGLAEKFSSPWYCQGGLVSTQGLESHNSTPAAAVVKPSSQLHKKMCSKSWVSLVQFTLPETRANWAKENHNSEPILPVCTSLIRMWGHLETGNQRFFPETERVIAKTFLKQHRFFSQFVVVHITCCFFTTLSKKLLPLIPVFTKQWRFRYHMHRWFFKICHR